MAFSFGALALGGAGVAALAAAAALVERRGRPRRFDLIRRGKEQWEATFDALSEGIALVDADGAIRRANAALAGLAGRPVTAIADEDLGAALFGDRLALAELLRAAGAGSHPAPVVRRSDTLGRVLRLAAAPLARAVDGAAAVVVVEDITEQQALEAQLIQSEKMAAVGTLVSGLAHELNNPLTSIAGLSEFLLEQPGTAAPQREHLRVINEQAERAGRIVRDLLAFARQGPGERASVDLGDLVERTVQLMGYELRRRGATAEVDAAPGLPPVWGDRHQLQQVALNLIGNAAQAVASLPEGRPRLVRIHVADEGGRVVLRVADTGPGLSAEVQARMFSPFFTTKAPGEGTGLGLFVSYGIAAAHGGTLTAESRPGQGATLVLSLPPAGAAGGPTESAGSGDAAERRWRILVVDDDPVVRQVVSVLFSREGHRVDAAVGGADALRLAEGGRYDLAIADRLASAGNEPLAAALGRLPGGLGSRLILTTSDARADGAAGGPLILRKPFDLHQLKRTAEDVIRASEQVPDGEGEVAPSP
jgi:signal transduction histidine kinase/CheY-like chemotaxis protein